MAGTKYFMEAKKLEKVLSGIYRGRVFFIYTHFIDKPMPVPSAIINSFTGSVSSVMILETPETREIILWYNEDTDMESEHDAV